MSHYRLFVNNEKTDHVVEGTSPAKALKQLVEMADMMLHDQDGRYGKAFTRTERGSWSYAAVPVSALTMPYTRRRLDPQERTTRL